MALNHSQPNYGRAATRILGDSNAMSIMDHARAELERANIDAEDQIVMLGIIQHFLRQWDSGGSAAVMVEVFNRLISGQPLSPLTGEESEWLDRSDINDGKPIWQNARCSSVFRIKVGDEFVCYDIDAEGEIPADENGLCRITFPYDPMTHIMKMPVIEFDVSQDEDGSGYSIQ